MTASTTNEVTGEIYDADVSTPQQIVDEYRRVNATIDAYEKLKKILQAKATTIVDDRGTFEHNGYQLRVMTVQRQTYDMTVIREVIEDEDTINGFLELSKGKVDRYLKDHLDELGEGSTRLRDTMVEVGRPYQVVRLERLSNPQGEPTRTSGKDKNE